VRYRRYGVGQSGSNEFFSDENLKWEPASYQDFAPLPGEVIDDARAASPMLRSHEAAGNLVFALPLADIEVDDFSRDPSEPSALSPNQASAGASDDAIDRIADLVLKRLEDKLSGGH